MRPMRLLHTSDWHLGKTLYGQRRYAEFSAFLDWLHQTLIAEAIDVLVVAGDIFDTTTPSNTAQGLYYRFLNQVRTTPCRHVVIVAGNHDSPTLLEAPRELLKHLNVHVVGTANPEHELLELKDIQGHTEMILCAVPYLRDRELRSITAGESLKDKAEKLQLGIARHYNALAEQAKALQAALSHPVPLVATGHLFASGGQTGDGVRELYVGSLAHVPAQIFDPCFDYVALGHLHLPQQVSQQDHIRYSGAPLAMGFGEARQNKRVRVVTFEAIAQTTNATPSRSIVQHGRDLTVPRFQRLERLTGDLEALQHGLADLKAADESIWLEVEYTGSTLRPQLRELLMEQIKDSLLQLLAVHNRVMVQQALSQSNPGETLEQLDPQEVFERLLSLQSTQQDIDAEQQEQLKQSHREIVVRLQEMDIQA